MDDVILSIALRITGVLALVFANGFFVAAEFSLVTVRKTRIDQLIAEGSRRARTVRRALTDPDSYIAATQLGITISSLGLGWIGEPALASMIEPALFFMPAPMSTVTAHSIAVAIAFSIITSLHIVLGELAPKSVALQYAEKTALIVARPTEIFMRAFWPFISLLNGMGRAVVEAFGMQPPSGHSLVHSQEELKMLVTASQEAGVLEEDEEQMLHRVFDFADLTAGQVMVPRTELVAVPESASLDQVIAAVSHAPHNLIPVYGRDLDDLRGLLHIKDLVRIMAERPADFSLAALVREPITVPITMRADQLLDTMRRHRTHHAIVIDEHGGTAGLVTLQALIERIVGEVAEGAAGVSGKVLLLSDGSASLDGLSLVPDINERFGLHIDDATYNTIGGFVLGKLGRQARIGDVVEVEGRRMTVEGLDGLRVSRVKLSRPRGGQAVPRATERRN
jgi:CBS domain containing-hemolysin-like protein